MEVSTGRQPAIPAHYLASGLTDRAGALRDGAVTPCPPGWLESLLRPSTLISLVMQGQDFFGKGLDPPLCKGVLTSMDILNLSSEQRKGEII